MTLYEAHNSQGEWLIHTLTPSERQQRIAQLRDLLLYYDAAESPQWQHEAPERNAATRELKHLENGL